MTSVHGTLTSCYLLVTGFRSLLNFYFLKHNTAQPQWKTLQVIN